MSNTQHIEEIAFTSAEDFLAYLRPSNSHWGEKLSSTWIFRGHWDSSWELLPTAWRDDSRQKLEPIHDSLARVTDDQMKDCLFPRPTDETMRRVRDVQHLLGDKPSVFRHLRLIAAEHEAVEQFATLCDELGLPALESGESARGGAAYCLFPFNVGWPYYEPTQIYGLAQHHGVPTGLLDWTLNPIVAAYFAADLETRKGEPENLCVWAFDRGIVDLKGTINTLTCPRHGNSFLHAQSGLFTYIHGAYLRHLEDDTWPTLDSIVEEEHKDYSAFKKITLPTHEADPLLRLLTQERLTKAHLMPTYDNVAKSIQTRWTLEAEDVRADSIRNRPTEQA